MTRQKHTSLSVFFALLSIGSLILVSVTTTAYADIPSGPIGGGYGSDGSDGSGTGVGCNCGDWGSDFGGSWGSDFGGGWDSAGESGSADAGGGSGGGGDATGGADE